jgi:MATE family multidrug resistance protein
MNPSNKINKELLRLAVPNILSNISVPLLSSVDTALMGHESIKHLGAVGIGAMIFNFLYWNFGFLRMGTTGFTAQAYGAKDQTEIISTLLRAAFLALCISVLLVLFSQVLGGLAIDLMFVQTDQIDLVLKYFSIRILAAPASLMLFVLFGWYFGMQNSIFPLIITITLNIVNILLSFLFVKQYGRGIEGVAWGTVAAQYIGLVIALLLFLIRYRSYLNALKLSSLKQVDKVVSFLKINGDIFIRTFCLTFVFGFFYSQSSKMQANTLEINTILMQFLNWMSYGVDGFAYAAESLVGKYLGAENKKRMKLAVRQSFIWGMGFAFLYAIVYWAFGTQLLEIFTNDTLLIQSSLQYLIWMVILPIIGTPCYIWDGIFVGLAASKQMRNGMFISMLSFLLIFYSVQSEFGNHGLWFSLSAFLVFRALILWWYYSKGSFKRI